MKKPTTATIIKINPLSWDERNAWGAFTQQLTTLKSAGDIRQDKLRSVPLLKLPMV